MLNDLLYLILLLTVAYMAWRYGYRTGYIFGVDEAYTAVNRQIKRGHLRGNGCDETAQRNGLVLASNEITKLKI